MNHKSLHAFSPRALMKRFGTSYFFASLFFPQEIQHATQTLYRFVRIPDEYVDSPEGGSAHTQHLLESWRETWNHAWTESVDEEVIREAVLLFKKYHIPKRAGDDFIAAMIQDVHVQEYESYEALRTYMHGSAMVIGEMMTYIIGGKVTEALPYAHMLGEAMQWTNFLRDVGEDYTLRQRIYLPKEWYTSYGITKTTLAHCTVTDEWRTGMRAWIAHGRNLFAESRRGISLLSPRGRRAVYAASILYEAILDEIEKNDYDVFTRRARISRMRRARLLLSSFINS
jgi:15-cis-phytoene synthase